MAGNNLEDFKERLDKYLQSITDVPEVMGNIPSARGDLKANPPILNFLIQTEKHKHRMLNLLEGWVFVNVC